MRAPGHAVNLLVGFVVEFHSIDHEADGSLMRRYAEGRDERAFEVLVQRHGSLVAGVCARLLANRSDADDAFQAVFLVLARKAPGLTRWTSLAGWLHQVAVRVCLNERRTSRRRERLMEAAARLAQEKSRGDRMHDLKGIIDEELQALPRRLRDVLILCDLNGHTKAEAARNLAVPIGTVSNRLLRGREVLRRRLARHGLICATGGVGFVLAECAQAAPTPLPELVRTTVHNANIFLAGNDAMQSAISLHVHSLARGALKTMVLSQWKTAACLFALCATSLWGGAMAPGLVRTAFAGKAFVDEFDDGSVTDGNPVSWNRLAIHFLNNGGTRVASDGSFFITPGGVDGLDEMDFEVAGEIYGDVSIRTRVVAGAGNQIGLFVRSTTATLTDRKEFNLTGDMLTNGALRLGYGKVDANGEPYAELLAAPVQTGWQSSNQEINLQLDVVGDTMSLTGWRVGDIKPATPQVVANVSGLTNGHGEIVEQGTVGLWVSPNNPNLPAPGTAAFRFFEVLPITTEGDANFDGHVDIKDLNEVRNHFGEGEPDGLRVAGDVYPFDGVVDVNDLNQVRNHFGAGSVAAPEPSSLSLAGAMGGLVYFATFVQRRRG